MHTKELQVQYCDTIVVRFYFTVSIPCSRVQSPESGVHRYWYCELSTSRVLCVIRASSNTGGVLCILYMEYVPGMVPRSFRIRILGNRLTVVKLLPCHESLTITSVGRCN